MERDFGRTRAVLSALLPIVLFAASITVLIAVDATPASATPTIIQSKTFGSISSATTITATFTSTTTVGDTIIAGFTVDDNLGTSITCTDSSSNVYSAVVVDDDVTEGQLIGVCYAPVTTAGTSTVTVHLPGSTDYRGLNIHEYSGIATSSPVDGTSSFNGTSVANGTNSVTSNTATTTTSGDLIFGLFENDSGGTATVTAGTGFTIEGNTTVMNAHDLTTEDEILASPGSVAATETWNIARTYEGMMLAFKPTPPAVPVHQLTNVSVAPSDPTPGNASTWTVQASSTSGGTVRCLGVWVDTSSSFGSSSSSATFTGNPGGTSMFTAGSWTAGPTSVGSSSETKWVSSSGMTYASGSNETFTLGVTANPAAGTYYIQVTLYSDSGCLTAIDTGVSAVVTNATTTVSVTIDPAFTFVVANQSSTCNGESNFLTTAGSASAIALGHLAAGANVSGGQALTITGNSGGGFAVYITGTQASQNLRSGSHNWTDVAGSYASPAALGAGERFGYTYKDSTSSSSVTNPSSANFVALTNATTNKVMGSTTSEVGSGCVSFDAQTSAATPAAVYSATVVYTAVPTF